MIIRLQQYLKRKDINLWELTFALGFVVALIAGMVLHGQQTQLSDKLVRFHVLANSDSEQDQALKLQVRDNVLALTDDLMEQAGDSDTAMQTLEQNLPALESAAQETVYAQGYDYPVQVSVGQDYFPTRNYDTFCLPAGRYDTLRVTIGRGDGHNWWCVVFPPMCFGAAEDFDAAVEAANLSDDEVRLITEDGQGYRIKFKMVEIVEKLLKYMKKE